MFRTARCASRPRRFARAIVFLVPLCLLAACSGPGADPPGTAAATLVLTPRAVATLVAAPSPTASPVAATAAPTPTVPAPSPAGSASAVASTPVAGSAVSPTRPPVLTVPPSTGPLPPAFRIAFVSNRDGGNDLWTMDADGRRLANLTRGQKQKGSDSDPQWSPDGRRIAFVSDRDGQSDIWLMNADGTGARNLTRGGGDDLNPRWSPDGRRIAFVSLRDNDAEVYVMTAEGAEQTNLTKSDGDDLQPVWSPDSARIAFVSDRGKRPRALYVMPVDSPKNPPRLAGPPCDVANPVWSPDGAMIAAVSCLGADGQGAADTVRRAVYTIPAGGGNLTAASDRNMDSGAPAFAPDGKALAFFSYRSPQQADIVVLTLGGGARRTIQGPPGAAREPSWSLDGALLAFVAGDFTVGNIIIAEGGGAPRNLTNNVANERTPRWSPVKLP